MKRIFLVSGISYVMIFITGLYSNFVILERLFDADSSLRTTQNLINNLADLKLGIFGFIVMLFFDLVLVWSLYVLFEKINRRVAQLASILRFLNATIFGIALINLLALYQLISDKEIELLVTNSWLQEQVLLYIERFNNIWTTGLIFFGLHLLFLSYLILKSKFFPKAISVLLSIAALGYLIDGFSKLCLPFYSTYTDIFSAFVIIPGVVGELSFTILLINKGVKKKVSILPS